jgi:hypothetical protein
MSQAEPTADTGKSYWQEDVKIPFLDVDISRMMLAIIIVIFILFIYAIYAGASADSKKGGFMAGPPTGVQAYKQLGKFGVGWGVGSIAAMQGAVSAGDPSFAYDDMSVQQINFEKHTEAKNMSRCGPGYWYGEDVVRRADNGTVQLVGACYPEGDTLLNPTATNPTGGAAAPAAPSVSGYQARGHMKLAKRKSGFDPKGPEGITCSEMWGYDADAELGAAVLMSTYGSQRGPDEDVLERELQSLE